MSLLDRRAGQANIVLGARAPSYRDERRFVADILNVVLGEGMSSRLFLELREERGLAYDVHSFLTRVADSGTLAISLGASPSAPLVAMRAAVAELRRLATEPVPHAELERAKEYARGRLAVQLESTSALCNHLGQQELLTGEILLASDIAERLLRGRRGGGARPGCGDPRRGSARRGDRSFPQARAVPRGARRLSRGARGRVRRYGWSTMQTENAPWC